MSEFMPCREYRQHGQAIAPYCVCGHHRIEHEIAERARIEVSGVYAELGAVHAALLARIRDREAMAKKVQELCGWDDPCYAEADALTAYLTGGLK